MPKEKAILQPVPSSLNVISVANASNTSYSLAKDKESKRKQIFNLEKQASLADQLLNRAEDRQISQLMAKKKTCLEKKEVLQNAIQNIDQVQFLISQFKLLFEFVEAFSVFSISLLSSIEEEKVIRQKLASLKKTEKNLMALASSESYFSSEAFGELNYFAYQAYIESYRKNFFLGLTSAGSQYNDYVLLAGEIRTCFGNAYLAITKDAFNLKSISAFLCRTISQLALPNSEYCLIGLWIYFFYTVLFAFVELKPITSNLDKIKLAVEFHAQVLAFNFKENYFHNLISLTRRFDTLEKKVANFFCQDKPLTTREESRVVLNFITKTHNEILIFEKK